MGKPYRGTQRWALSYPHLLQRGRCTAPIASASQLPKPQPRGPTFSPLITRLQTRTLKTMNQGTGTSAFPELATKPNGWLLPLYSTAPSSNSGSHLAHPWKIISDAMNQLNTLNGLTPLTLTTTLWGRCTIVICTLQTRKLRHRG